MALRYVHTNLVARDWERLATFYERALGCVRLAPERHLRGPALSAGVGHPDATLDGVHLRLPGFGEEGPTLEVYAYRPLVDAPASVRRAGLGHLAFAVSDAAELHAARERVFAEGGSAVGEVVSTRAGSRVFTWCYVADPEGNGIELQCSAEAEE